MKKIFISLLSIFILFSLSINSAQAFASSSTSSFVSTTSFTNNTNSFNSLQYRDSFAWFAFATNFSSNITFKGKGVKVAVLDTGVDGTHPFLKDNVLEGFDALNFKTIQKGSFSDFDGHGTHVAGLVNFFAPKASIIPVRVLGLDNSGVENPIAAGIYWAVDAGADVINLSLGSTSDFNSDYNKSICAAIDFATKSNVVVVAASGNSGFFDNPEVFPSSCKNVISVAAVNEFLNPAWFSSYDSNVTLAAPGTNIISTVPLSKASNFNVTGFSSLSGTSMAAPMVSAATALLLESGVAPIDVKTVLTSNSFDIAPIGRDPFTGFGLLDFSQLFNSPPANYVPFANIELVNSFWYKGSTFFSFKPSSSLTNPNYVVVVNNLSLNTVTSYAVPSNFVRFSFPTSKKDLVVFSIVDTVSELASPVFMSPNDGFSNRTASSLVDELSSFYNLSLNLSRSSSTISDLAVIFFTENLDSSSKPSSKKFYMKVILAAPKGIYRVSFPNSNLAGKKSLRFISPVLLNTSRKYSSVLIPVSRQDFMFFTKLNDFVKVSVNKI